MSREELPPVLLSQKRYNNSIPSGKISQFSPTEVPIISKKGTHRNGTLSMHDITDPNIIDQKLKSMSHVESEMMVTLEVEKKEKANLKFLRYKFNPGGGEEEGENVERSNAEQYGQLGKQSREKISVNIFYEHKNVLFQDERAPLVYKKLFLLKEENYS